MGCWNMNASYTVWLHINTTDSGIHTATGRPHWGLNIKVVASSSPSFNIRKYTVSSYLLGLRAAPSDKSIYFVNWAKGVFWLMQRQTAPAEHPCCWTHAWRGAVAVRVPKDKWMHTWKVLIWETKFGIFTKCKRQIGIQIRWLSSGKRKRDI